MKPIKRKRKRRKWIKRMFFVFILAMFIFTGIVFLPDAIINTKTKNRIYTDIESVAEKKVGLVLGCCKILPNGRENLYFTYRIQAAADLYSNGKVQYLLVSGDNGRKEYDETSAMKKALVEMGVPDDRIICDYAGFRTLDSVVRAKKVFLEDDFIIISQKFHIQRALFIADSKDIHAIGYCAKDVSFLYDQKMQLREKGARTKAFLDLYLLNKQPKYLGETIEIGKPVSSKKL